MAIIDNKIIITDKKRTMWYIANDIKKHGQEKNFQTIYNAIYDVNPQKYNGKTLKTRHKGGTLCDGMIIHLPYGFVGTERANSKCSSVDKVKSHTNSRPHTQVCKDSRGKVVPCKRCIPAPWMAVALKEAKQVKGRKKWKISSTIKKYFKYSRPNSSYGPETSWCMAFVCWTLKEGKLTIERKFIGSQWLRFSEGHTKKISTPFYGAIAIWQDVRKIGGKWKPTKGGNGHISMVYGKLKNGKYVFLGGNQGKTIKLTVYDTSGKVFTAYGSTKRRFVGFYKPEEYIIKKCDTIKKVKSLDIENKKITGKSIKTLKNERT